MSYGVFLLEVLPSLQCAHRRRPFRVLQITTLHSRVLHIALLDKYKYMYFIHCCVRHVLHVQQPFSNCLISLSTNFY